ncbi:hypothetical protein, partial [Kitasatospora sp. NPDC007106]
DMGESWVFDDGTAPATVEAALDLLRGRIAAGRLETWLAASSGRSLGVVSNGERAMVLLLDPEGDPGGHAVDPLAAGRSTGFVLTNGQHDEYPDTETVPLPEGLRIVGHVLATGVPPVDADWSDDR